MNNIIMDSQLLSTLMSCPRKADFRFNKNLSARDGKSNSLEAGSLAHVILEFYNRALIEGKPRSDCISIGYEAGKEYINGYQPGNKYILDDNERGCKNLPEIGDSKVIGWSWVYETLAQYFDYYRLDNLVLVGVEEVRQKVIYEDESLRVLWKAKFDNILDMPNGFMSRDYKTSKQNRTTLSLNNQFMGQCVLLGGRNVMIDKIGWQKSLAPKEKFERAIISYSPDRLAEWANEIIPYYANMLIAYSESANYPPNFTNCESKYGWCEFKEICETDRNIRDERIEHLFVEGKKWDVLNED
jgi:hypothetical protein